MVVLLSALGLVLCRVLYRSWILVLRASWSRRRSLADEFAGNPFALSSTTLQTVAVLSICETGRGKELAKNRCNAEDAAMSVMLQIAVSVWYEWRIALDVEIKKRGDTVYLVCIHLKLFLQDFVVCTRAVFSVYYVVCGT